MYKNTVNVSHFHLPEDWGVFRQKDLSGMQRAIVGSVW